MLKAVDGGAADMRDVLLEAPFGRLRLALPEGWLPEIDEKAANTWAIDSPDDLATVYVYLHHIPLPGRQDSNSATNREWMRRAAEERFKQAEQPAAYSDLEQRLRDHGGAIHLDQTYLGDDESGACAYFHWMRFLDMGRAGLRLLNLTLAADPEWPELLRIRGHFARQADRLVGQINGQGWHGGDDVGCQEVELDGKTGKVKFLLPFDWSYDKTDNGMWICISPDGQFLAEVDNSFISAVGLADEEPVDTDLGGMDRIRFFAAKFQKLLSTLPLEGEIKVRSTSDRIVVHAAFHGEINNRLDYVRRWYVLLNVNPECALFRIAYATADDYAQSPAAHALAEFFDAQIERLSFITEEERNRQILEGAAAQAERELPPDRPGWARHKLVGDTFLVTLWLPLEWSWSQVDEGQWHAADPAGRYRLTAGVNHINLTDDVAASMRTLVNMIEENLREEHEDAEIKSWHGESGGAVAAMFMIDEPEQGRRRQYAWHGLRVGAEAKEAIWRAHSLTVPVDAWRHPDFAPLIAIMRADATRIADGLPDQF